MRYAIRQLAAAAALTILASCGGVVGAGTANMASPAVSSAQTVSDDPIKLDAPYTVGTTTYTPQDTPQYDEVGYVGFYPPEFAGRKTASGETYRPAGASAAHKTLPLPSYVEVTSLDTGRTILVRVNDRGPLHNDRLIDLSEGAARQLGIDLQGAVGVRVRRVNPPEQEKMALREGVVAAERIETPGALLKVLRDKLAKQPRIEAIAQTPLVVGGKAVQTEGVEAVSNSRFVREGDGASKPEASTKSKPVATGGYVAQIGAFASRQRADALARKAGGSVSPTSDDRLFRVRLGPFVTEAQAASAARQKGYPQARVYRD